MRIFLAVLSIAVLAGTAGAQDMGGRRGKGHGSPQSSADQKADQKKKQAIDDAYKSAIGRMPDATTKYDPWKAAR